MWGWWKCARRRPAAAGAAGPGQGAPAWEVERARIVMLAAEGVLGKQIAALVGCAEPKVVTWRGRSAERGMAGWRSCRGPEAGAVARGAAGSRAGADLD